MEETDLKLFEISEMVGYRDVNHFHPTLRNLSIDFSNDVFYNR